MNKTILESMLQNTEHVEYKNGRANISEGRKIYLYLDKSVQSLTLAVKGSLELKDEYVTATTQDDKVWHILYGTIRAVSYERETKGRLRPGFED